MSFLLLITYNARWNILTRVQVVCFNCAVQTCYHTVFVKILYCILAFYVEKSEMLFVDSLYDPRNFCSSLLIIKRCFVFVSGTATPVIQINHLMLYFRFYSLFLTHESWLHVVFFHRLTSIDYGIERPNVKSFLY